jgi:hypothetical protein
MVLVLILALSCTPPTPTPTPTPTAVRLVFTQQPDGGTAGSAFTTQPVVSVEDAEGNIVTNYRGLVVLTITEDTGVPGATLFGGTTVGLENGMVEFRELSIDKAGIGYRLTATSGSLESAISTPFTIVPGAPAKLAFTTQPSKGTAGSPLTPSPEVTVQDIHGNMVTSFEGSVTVSATVTYEEEKFPVALSGTTTVRVVNGAARFTDIAGEFAIPGYTLTAVSASLASATSRSFEVLPAAPVKLEFTVQPSAAKAGTPFETQPKVAVLDTYGNVVNSSRVSVNLSITPGTGTDEAILSGAKSVITDGGFFGGLAEFTDLSVDQAGAGYTLTAISSDLASAVSQSFDVISP